MTCPGLCSHGPLCRIPAHIPSEKHHAGDGYYCYHGEDAEGRHPSHWKTFTREELQAAAEMMEAVAKDTQPGEAIITLSYYRVALRTALALWERVEKAEARSKAWEETALQHHRNETFYANLLDTIGEFFGPAARRSDDGSMQQDVLALRVPELVAAQQAKLTQAEAALRPFAEDAKMYQQVVNEDYRPANFLSITLGDLRRAAAYFQPPKDTQGQD